jgi:hypothetical protein
MEIGSLFLEEAATHERDLDLSIFLPFMEICLPFMEMVCLSLEEPANWREGSSILSTRAMLSRTDMVHAAKLEYCRFADAEELMLAWGCSLSVVGLRMQRS